MMERTLPVLRQELRQKRDDVLRRQAERDTLTAEYEKADASLGAVLERLRVQDAAQVFLRELAEQQQETMRQKVSALVTFGLRTVFDEDLEFTVTMDSRGNQVVMGFAIRNKDGFDVDVMDAEGGGLVALAALLLRIVMLLAHRPRLTPMLVGDEPLTQLSECYREPAAALLRRLVDKGLLRLLFVTHDATLAAAADVRYRTILRDGETKITRIEEARAEDDR